MPRDNQTEKLYSKQEKRKLTPKQFGSLFCATVAFGSAMAGVAGCSNQKTVGELTEKPAAEATVNAGGKEDIKVPKEAELFVMEFGDRYDDPVSTYFAYQALKASTGVDTVIPDGTLATYVETQQYTNKNVETGGPLDFTTYRLPLDTEVDENTLVKIFNDYTSGQLSLYMNYLSKNQTADGLSVVDTQFKNYCSDTTQFNEDDRYVEGLMDSVKPIVEKYGSSANYTVLDGVIDGSDPNTTSFTPGTFGETSFVGYENSDFYDSTAKIVIAVDSYHGDKVVREYEVIDNARLTVIRQPFISETSKGFTFISIGQFVN